MLTQPDSATIVALAQIGRSQAGEALQKLLVAELDAIKDRLIASNDAPTDQRLKGRYQVVKEFLDLLRKSPEIAAKQ